MTPPTLGHEFCGAGGGGRVRRGPGGAGDRVVTGGGFSLRDITAGVESLAASETSAITALVEPTR